MRTVGDDPEPVGPGHDGAGAALAFLSLAAGLSAAPVERSGIHPELAYFNDEGACGTGAVVPWADRLWVITYGPH
ncbi:MAG: hypothetical protein ACKOQ9_04065, partial [Verrucomicrobiota bacterium]